MAEPSVMMEYLGNVVIQWDKWMRKLCEDCEVVCLLNTAFSQLCLSCAFLTAPVLLLFSFLTVLLIPILFRVL